MHANSPIPLVDAKQLESAARTWAAPLLQAAGPALRAFYIYGSALGPAFERRTSNVNLLLVVHELDFARLSALARALPVEGGPGSDARTREGFHFAPLVLSEAQLRDSADVFPIDYLDLLDQRALLAGEDVIAAIEVSLENLRHQCEYELRSRLIGLRQSYLRARGERGVAHRLTVHAASGSSSLLRHLLTLRRRPFPADPAALCREVGEAFGVPAAGLYAPYEARRATTEPSEEEARTRFGAYLAALEALTQAVDAILPD
jgi:hypothetical protein